VKRIVVEDQVRFGFCAGNDELRARELKVKLLGSACQNGKLFFASPRLTELTTVAKPDLVQALSCLEFGIGWLIPGKWAPDGCARGENPL